MSVMAILCISIFLQIMSVGLALSLLRVTGWSLAWLFIACAMALMVLRRVVQFWLAWRTGVDPELASETVALGVSIFMTCGVLLIGPLLRDMRQNERSLVESQRRLDLLLNAANIGLWDWNVLSREVYFSPRWKLQLGYQDHELPNRFEEWESRLHPGDRDRMRDLLDDYIKNPRPRYEAEFRLRHKNGSYRTVLARAECTFDERGRLSHMMGCHIDVTDHKMIEVERTREQNLLRTLIDNLPDSVYVKDLDGRIIASNLAHRRLIGAKNAQDVLGKTAHEFFPQEVAKRIAADDAKIYAGQTLLDSEQQLQGPDGKTHWCWITKAPLFDETGSVRGLVGITRDITDLKRQREEQRRLEVKVLQAQKLESLGVLAGGIAHDFNNLLTGILGNASLAAAYIKKDSPASENLAQIELAAQRAGELCGQMLAYSGKGRFVVSAVDLSALVREMAHILQVSISKTTTLRLNLSDNAPRIAADATQLRQVVMNLITNASEAIGNKSGVVTITTGVTHCDSKYLATSHAAEDAVEGDYSFVEVSDNGCGMDATTREKIFDPFFTTKFAGRGLGLAAVLGIIKGHRGAIRVRSEVGSGTTIKVMLPPSREQYETLPISEGCVPPDWRASGTALVIDDEDAVRMVAKATLEHVGFEVIGACDGQAGIDAFSRNADRISVVLLDLTLPRLGGEDVFREIQRMKPGFPVVLSSGYSEHEATQRFTGKGLAGFLQKPFRAQELIERVRAALA